MICSMAVANMNQLQQQQQQQSEQQCFPSAAPQEYAPQSFYASQPQPQQLIGSMAPAFTANVQVIDQQRCQPVQQQPLHAAQSD